MSLIVGTTFEPAILRALLGGSPATQPATLYAALMTALPSAGGGGTEVSGFAYARVAVTNNTTNWPTPTTDALQNATAIVFPAASGGDWGTVAGLAFYDASTGGNLYVAGQFTDTSGNAVTKTISNGDTFQIPAGGAVFSL